MSSSQKRRPCSGSWSAPPDLLIGVRKCCGGAEFKRKGTKRQYASPAEHTSLFFTGLCNRRCGPGSCQSPWASCRRLAAALGCYCHIWQCGYASAAEPSCRFKASLVASYSGLGLPVHSATDSGDNKKSFPAITQNHLAANLHKDELQSAAPQKSPVAQPTLMIWPEIRGCLVPRRDGFAGFMSIH